MPFVHNASDSVSTTLYSTSIVIVLLSVCAVYGVDAHIHINTCLEHIHACKGASLGADLCVGGGGEGEGEVGCHCDVCSVFS